MRPKRFEDQARSLKIGKGVDVKAIKQLRGFRLGDWSALVESRSAVGTVVIIDLNRVLALRTIRTQFLAATRAELEVDLDRPSALRAGARERLP